MNVIEVEAGDHFAKVAAAAREEEEKRERLRLSCIEGSLVSSFFLFLLSAKSSCVIVLTDLLTD